MRMCKFSDLKLRNQLLLLTSITVVLVISLQTAYYIRLTSITKDKMTSLTDQSASQVEETIRIMFDKIKNSATFFAYSSSVQRFMSTSDVSEKKAVIKYIEDMIKTVADINTEINDVILIDHNGKRIYYYNDYIRQDEQLIDEIQNRKIDKGVMYLKTENNREYIVYVMPVIYMTVDSKYGMVLGTIAVTLNTEILNRVIKKQDKSGNISYYLIDSNNLVVAASTDIKNNNLNKMDLGTILLDRNITVSKDILSSGWSVIGHVNESDVVKDYEFFKNFGMMVGLIMILLLIATGIAFNSSFAFPVAKLLREIDKVGKENLKVRIRMSSHNEIGDIAANINRMLDNHEALSKRIFETQQKMYEVELSKKQTEMYALQSQVNPHFLFNTLQCIGGIAMSRDIPEVAEVVMAMGEIFRYSIKANDFVSIEDEVNIAKQYLKIIDIRFGGKIQYKINIKEEILELKTVKMILQPIIENAIYHGLEKTYADGRLCVDGWKEEDCVIFKIWDNGPGIKEAELNRILSLLNDMYELEKEGIKRKSIGIANIQWRIKLMLGENYGIQINSNRNEGTTVIVKIPIISPS